MKKNLCRRLVSLAAVFIFLSVSFFSMPVSADSGWQSSSIEPYVQYGFSSFAVWQKSVNQGVVTEGCYAKDLEYTHSFPKVYEKYGYTSQAEFETAINGGKNFGAINDWFFQLTGAEGTAGAGVMCTPEIGVPIVVASQLMGVKFGSGEQAKNFIQNYWNYCTKDYAPFANKAADQLLLSLTLLKNGYSALAPEAMKALQSFVGKYVGISNATVEIPKGDKVFTLGSTDVVEYYDIPVTQKEVERIENSSTNDSIFQVTKWTTFTSVSGEITDWGSGSSTDLSSNHQNQWYEEMPIGPYGGESGTWHYKFLYHLTYGSSAIVTEKFHIVDSYPIGNCSDVINGAPSRNKDYSNTWDTAEDAPPWVCDPTKTHTIGDAVNDKQAVGNPSLPIARTKTADTSIAKPTDTDLNPPKDWSLPSTDINWKPFENINLWDKFPFSLPWDVKNIISSLVAEPKVPKWDIDIPMKNLNLPDYKFTIDFSQYDVAFVVIRWGILLVFTGGLAFATYKLIKH